MMIQCERCNEIYTPHQYGEDFGLCPKCDAKKIEVWRKKQLGEPPTLVFRKRYFDLQSITEANKE